MPINHIQFQPGLSLPAFMQQYGSAAQCYEALVASRWPCGFVCPRCGGRHHWRTADSHSRPLWQCAACDYQCSATAGTVFEHTRLPLNLWFLAIYLISQSKHAISALELKRHLGVRYKTAWGMKHKLLEVMRLRDEDTPLSGRVEIDDAYLGGQRAGHEHGGRGALHKAAFVAAVQTSQQGHPQRMRLSPVTGFTNEAIAKWAPKNIAPGSTVVSDGTACFAQVTQANAVHERYVTGGGRQAAEFVPLKWVNVMLGNVKMSMTSTYRGIKHAKYAARYLAEFCWRFNRRYDLAALPQRLLKAAVQTKPQPIRILQQPEQLPVLWG